MTYLLLVVGMSFSFGQNKKDKKAKDKTVAEVSKEKKVQAEYYFTEGMKNFIIDDYTKALIYFKKSLELDPENAAAYFKIAEINFKGGKFDAAEENAKKALSLNKKNKYFYLLAADIYQHKAQPQEAAHLMEEMYTHTDASPFYLFDLASFYIQSNNYDKALKVYEKAEKEFGVIEEIVSQKQKLYLQQNKLDEAIAEGEKLVKYFPEEPKYVLMQAEIMLTNERIKQAQTYLEQYLQKDPENDRAHYLLAKVYQQTGNYVAADKHIKAAFSGNELDLEIKIQELVNMMQQLPDKELEKLLIQLTSNLVKEYPNKAEVHTLKGDLYVNLNQKENARKKYLQALKLDESNFSVWQNVLSIGLELGRYDSVAKEAEEALSLFPNQASLYYFSGAANLSKKDYNEAIFAFEQGKKLSANNKELLGIFNSHLGDAYNGLKKYDKSDEAYEAALRVSPDNDYILNNYSYYLSLRNEKLDLAKELSEKLIKKYPSNPNYLDTHAWVLYQLKEYTKARNYLEQALQHGGSKNGTILEHYGDVLYKLGEKEKALEQWKKAKSLANTSELIDKKIKEQRLYE